MNSSSTLALLRKQKPVIEIRASSDGKPAQKFVGRCAATLDALIQAGDGGLTSFEYPAPRVSDYMYRLRKGGLAVETITEGHAGPFSGSHGRYILRSEVNVIERVRAGEGRHAA
jgi:hypothetical protein